MAQQVNALAAKPWHNTPTLSVNMKINKYILTIKNKAHVYVLIVFLMHNISLEKAQLLI